MLLTAAAPSLSPTLSPKREQGRGSATSQAAAAAATATAATTAGGGLDEHADVSEANEIFCHACVVPAVFPSYLLFVTSLPFLFTAKASATALRDLTSLQK